jgi:hypothetical protein
MGKKKVFSKLFYMGHGKWGEREGERGQAPGRADGEMGGLPFWKEPAREDDARAFM